MMNEQQLDAATVEYGKRIGYFLENLDIPLSIKQALSEIVEILNHEQIDLLASSLEKALVEQLAVESTPEYREETEELDRQAVVEIEQIINN